MLVGLGAWQVERLAWKQGVLARIAAVEAAPPTPLPADGSLPDSYSKVGVAGRYRRDADALYAAEIREVAGVPLMGAQLVTPLIRAGAPPLLVERGWVRTDRPVPPPPEGELVVPGYVRPADTRGTFSAADDPAARRFFTLDPAVIGPALGVPDAAPAALVALGPPPADPAQPIPAQTLPRPPNDHAAYAATWFGLAAVLVVMFGFYVRKTLRS